ncbi:hypothetical protein [Arenimonas sp.]|uniref:hypothetical protein n=1 Tax=Arenimonas sp. TaxID=1872635 RepID=UPI0035B16145
MLEETTRKIAGSGILLSAALAGTSLLGLSLAQAQETPSSGKTGAAAQSEASARGIEKSDIRRGTTRDTDADGDGYADPNPVARQADLKKLADELVNVQGSPADTNGTVDATAATKVDAGNALNAKPANARAGDPIPDIDITENQSPGIPPKRKSDGSDETQEAVPALESNPIL